MEKNINEIENKIKIRGGDLTATIKDFVEKQKIYLEKEKQEEEKQTLDNIFNYSARDLEKLGVCIRKLDIIETTFESYGKYLTHFQKRTTTSNNFIIYYLEDIANKFTRYKFDTGDVVGLFEFSEKVQ
jgi:hypothetical protein